VCLAACFAVSNLRREQIMCSLVALLRVRVDLLTSSLECSKGCEYFFAGYFHTIGFCNVILSSEILMMSPKILMSS
jgi:hypothetical protein